MANGADGSITIDTTLDSSGFAAGSRQMLAAAARLTQQITTQGRTMEQNLGAVMRSAAGLGNALGRLSTAAGAGLTTDSQIERFATNLDSAREKLAEIEAQMARVGAQQAPTAEFSYLEKQIDKAYQKIGTLTQRMEMMQALGVDENANSYKRLCIELDDAKMNLEQLRAAQQQMISSGTAYTSGSDTAQYAALTEQLNAYKAAIAEFSNEQMEARSAADQAAAASDRQAAAKERAKLKTASATHHNNLLATTLKAIAGAAGRIPGAASVMVGGLKKFLMISNKSSNATDGLIKGLTGLGRMLKTRIKRMFIGEIFKSLTSGINNLAKFSSAFNSSISGMKNSLTGLSGNVAVAASNLVNALAPAIIQIINWISQAISYVNAFFALISGKGAYTRAATATDDYARSLRGAGGAAQDLKNQVYGFDELNKEQDKSGGGGGGGSGPEYEQVDIDTVLPENILNLFNALKEKFLQGEWNQIGVLIGGALNNIVTSVTGWINNTLNPMTTTWASRIAHVLNGMVTGIDWSSVGTMFASGLNTITQTANTFTSTFDWAAFGTKLGQGANSLVACIDWQALGTFFTTKTRIIWESLSGFVTTFDWAALGQSLATGTAAAFNSIDWVTLATTLGTAINGIWTTITTAMNAFDWTSAGATLAAAVNALFASEEGPIDWATAGKSFGDGLIGVINGISAFLAQVNWQQIGEDIATFITSIDWSGLLTALSTAIGTALGGLAQLLTGLISNAWQSTKTWWQGIMEQSGGNVIVALFNGILSIITGIGSWLMTNVVTPFINGIRTAFGLDTIETSAIYALGADLWAGFTGGIAAAWTAVSTWVDTNIVTPFVTAVKTFFGIASPSTVMEQIGGFLIKGMQNGITEAWTTMARWLATSLNSMITALSGTWTSIKTAASTGWQAIKTTVTGWWNSMSSTIATGVSSMQTALSGAWTSIKTVASTGWQAIKTTVIGWWNNMATSVATGVSSMKTALSSSWTSIKTAASTGWQSIKTTVTGLWNSMASAIATGVSSMTTALSSAWTSIKTAASTGWQGIKTTITGCWNSIASTIATGVSSMQTALSTAWTSVKTAASTGWTNVKTTVVGLWDDLVTAVTSTDWIGVGKNIVAGAKKGITDNWAKFKQDVTGWFSGLVSGVKKTLGIASPSKVFASIGDYCMQGLDKGFKDDEKTVMNTVSDIAKGIADDMDADANAKIGVGIPDNIDAAADKLSGVAAMFASIADSIERMGGLTIPSVAAGNVIPYQARIDASVSEPTQNASVMQKFTDNFDETMTDQLDVLKDILTAINGLNLTVDGSSLTRAITAIQRSNRRAYGGV